jgi:RNA polymerase sigma-70 factor (ECF subfamily)
MRTVGVREPQVWSTVTTDDQLFASLYPGLRRFAAIADLGGDPDDLVQEAVARTLRRQHLSDLEQPAAYLRRTILNLASNRRRSLARWRVAVTRLGPGAEALEPEYGSDLAELQRLSPEDRALLLLVVVEDLPYAEAAALLGITEEAARTRAARARRRLRDDLVEEAER